MTVPTRVTRPFRVRFDEATADGELRTSSYLRFMQDVAWVHSALAGFDLDWYRSHDVFWLIRCLQLRIERPSRHGSELDVSTQVTGIRRVWARRESEFRDGDGGLVALGTADWVMTSSAGIPARVPPELREVFSGSGTFEPARVSLDDPPPEAARSILEVRRQDIDAMGHVNNAVYVDYLEEAIARAGGEAALHGLPRVLRLEYLAPAVAGARLSAVAWPSTTGWSCRLTSADGHDLFRAVLEGAASH